MSDCPPANVSWAGAGAITRATHATQPLSSYPPPACKMLFLRDLKKVQRERGLKKLRLFFHSQAWISSCLEQRHRRDLVSSGVLLLSLEPVGKLGGLAGGGSLLALDLDGHVLVLLEAAGKVGLLGGCGGLGGVEDLNLTLRVGGLDGRDLVGLELLEVELLDEVG